MSVTPMMAQYLDIKAAHSSALLFYRMGDFYEMFFDDAVAAAEALDIALTKRGKHDGADIPMCGVPVHAAEGYLLTLIRKGFRVAVCEQMESPAEAKKRGSKSVVKRDVVRLVTPGTLTEESLLEARRHNYLAAFADVRGECALAWVDISTGSFQVMAIDVSLLGPELARLAPSELIASETKETDLREIADDFGIPVTSLGNAAFDSTTGADRVCSVFKVATLEAFGTFSRAEIGAMSALVEYLDITQKGNLPRLLPPQQEVANKTVQIDAATRRNLELTAGLNGGRAGSLLAVIDQTVTAAGARLLERRISSPSRSLDTVSRRLEAVDTCYDQRDLRQQFRDALRRVPDIDRALSRLSLDRGGPRDMAGIRNGLIQAQAIHDAVPDDLPQLLQSAISDLSGHADLVERLESDLIAEPPLLARDGGFIATGCDSDLDEARQLRDEGRSVIAQLQQQYIEKTGVQALKIKHNNVLGYFIEVTATHADKMMSAPLSETFIHRQTTANQVRFTTLELSDLETRILNAGGRALEIEKRLYDGLRTQILDAGAAIAQTARALAEIDVASALAELAESEQWCRPTLDTSRTFSVAGGRHPVVEAALKKQSGAPFIANDCDLSASDTAAIWLLTGPNMAGKSTFLRQNALIALLAQMGSYVPARSAHIGLVSQVFSRVGASDDLARGRSTFMVEMVETAAILSQATSNSLVILDEVGRGTSTYDGLALAWAVVEAVHSRIECRCLFATHYHELSRLAETCPQLSLHHVRAREWKGDLVLLHELAEGPADRSYGLAVAKLAGVPGPVIKRAGQVLEKLEATRNQTGGLASGLGELPLFAAAAETFPVETREEVLAKKLRDADLDALSPRDALDLLYELKNTLD